MNKGFLTVGIILLAIIALLIINVLSNYSTGTEVDYYLVKETAEAAMEDSIDEGFKRQHNGLLRMDKDYFVESFIRRFASNVNTTREYTISFYSMNEVPPKVSIKIESLTTLSVKNNKGERDAVNIQTTINELAISNKKVDNYTEYQRHNPYADAEYGINIKRTSDGHGYIEVAKE